MAALRDFEDGVISEDKAIELGLIDKPRGEAHQSPWSKARDAALSK